MHEGKTVILVLESVFHRGGAERVTVDVMRRLPSDRFEVVFCALYQPGPIGDEILAGGGRLYHSLIRSRYSIRPLPALRRIIRQTGTDLIYLINQPLTLLWGVVLGKLCRIPVVASVHNTVVSSRQVKLRSYRLLWPFVSRIVAVAELQKEHLVREEGAREDLVRVIPNGIDVTPFAQTAAGDLRERLKLPQKGPVVGLVARFVPLKGIDVFLRAAARLRESRPDAQFVLVGGGPELAAMHRLSQELGLEGSAHFLGDRDDVAEIESLFQVAVLSSRSEALPMVILEYMACAKPVVATNVGSVPEVVEEGVNGLLVRPDDPQALADKILYLLENPETSSRMGKQGRRMATGRFSVQRTVEQTATLFDQLVSGACPGRVPAWQADKRGAA